MCPLAAAQRICARGQASQARLCLRTLSWLAKYAPRYRTCYSFHLSSSHRNDFYQTPTTVIASFFLKKIDKEAAKVEFQDRELVLDLPTTDAPVPKRYKAHVPLYGSIDTAKSTFKILGTKLEVSLVKADGSSWPVLRSDDRLTGEILQIGRAGRA